MSAEVITALDDFVQKYVSQVALSPNKMLVEYDPDWLSECYAHNVGPAEEVAPGEKVEWQPVIRKDTADFSGMETALDFTIHADIKAFYSRYWSDNLIAKTEKGRLQLLQAWNLDDFERLQQNLIGHILMKRRLNQPETLFFGLTDEEDFILTLDNTSGRVMLEQVGVQPTEVLAPSLAEFIKTLEPNVVINN
ncbi:SecY-interacting protein [Paraglaciecola aquimarina]|uniref:Protein Syd n=1 Tax=Paraglaciecola algarum TaxID=3050085 RepID=A0ABS9D6N0_9ALTE|nr:SecY-interacting protein [Paraglaciecola sp. G1-23]